jgi:hypothetical protein
LKKGLPWRADDAGAALGWRLGLGDVLALDRVDPKAEKASKSLKSRKETYVGLHERNKARKIENGVARKMVRLEFIKIEELAEEVRSRKAEAALGVGGKDYGLSGFRRGLQLVAGNPARYLCRYPAGAVQLVNLRLLHFGALPGAAGRRGQVHTGT